MKGCLQNRVAMVSGGLGDIGRAIVVALAQEGAWVALGDILPEKKAGLLLRQLRLLGVKAVYHRVDVAEAGEVKDWVRSVNARLGIPTIAVPSAAVVTKAGACCMRPAEWERQLRVNLDGAFYLVREVARGMVRRRIRGHVVLIGSWAAHAAHHSLAPYCVSKAGLRMLCQCLALELAPHGILVNEVAPGYVDAGLTRRIWRRNPRLRQESLRRIPVGELISPAEIARQVVALCHSDNRHVTGSTVLMDGGLSLRR